MRSDRCSRLGTLGRIAVGVLCAASGSALAAGDPLAIDDARVRALLPGSDRTVAYCDVTNRSDAAIRLVRAESRDVRAIEFHTTIVDADMLRMRRLPDVTIAPGATVQFRAGGEHLMLFGVRSLGETLEITLVTDTGATVTAAFRQIPFGAQ